MLNYLTGRCDSVRREVFALLRDALDRSDGGEVILLVPDQYTLQAEIDTLNHFRLPGSFRLQVLSLRRLYGRIFQQAGSPRETLVDNQGRVMLMHEAAQRVSDNLAWYKSAAMRPGFAERCVSHVAAFKQAGVTPSDLREMANDLSSALARKLDDLSLLYETYEQALAGRFMDGEDESLRACQRMAQAPFLKDASVIVYGFDLITPILRNVILSLLQACRQVTVALVFKAQKSPYDFSLYAPVERSLNQLTEAARRQGAQIRRTSIPDVMRPGALGHLERELFSTVQTAYSAAPENVQLVLCRSIQEEAEFAAALVRRLCRTRGWRYRDFAVACVTDTEPFTGALRRAFQLYHVPLFLTEGRPADRHPLCACLLSALKAVTRNFAMADMIAYIRSGYSGLTDDEADILVNYAESHGLRGGRWLRPLTRGNEEEISEAEPLRSRLAQPLETLRQRAKTADSLQDTLSAVFSFLEDIRAYDLMDAQRQFLESKGFSVRAAEGVQVWNRIVEALDQMEELLSGANLSLQSVYELMRRALSAVQVKALPQSSDAVEGGPLEHLRAKPVKALLIVGASDAQVSPESGLLGTDELRFMRENGVDMGMDAQERQRMKRISLKSLLCMTESYLMISHAQSDEQGHALQCNQFVSETLRLLPGLRERGGLSVDEAMLRMKLEQTDAALCRLPGLLGKEEDSDVPGMVYRALQDIEEMEAPLEHMRASFSHKVRSESIGRQLSHALMEPVVSVSASRLEQFAACPFRHFARYALRPQEFRRLSLQPRDAGSFYHEALELFLRENSDSLHTLTRDDGQAQMDLITDRLLADLLENHTDTGTLARMEGEKLKRVARRAASIIVSQFDGSRFRPVSMEVDIEKDEVLLDGNTSVGGRIDRVDVWNMDDAHKYLRVIDYKTGGRSVSLQEIYYGLQMQLILYLATASAQFGGIPGGMFYFKVDDPLLDTDLRDTDAVEKEREKALRLDGLILNDPEVVAAMASAPEQVVHVAFNRDGSFRSSDKLVSSGDFKRLMAHAVETAQQMLRDIRSGATDIAPARLGSNTACRYCEYQTLCGYDERLDGAKPRNLKKLSGQTVLDALAEKYPGY